MSGSDSGLGSTLWLEPAPDIVSAVTSVFGGWPIAHKPKGDEMPAIGDRAPRFALEDTQGLIHELDAAPATAVVFTCNHCPYSLAWHQRLIDAAKDYADRGVRMLAINPNEAKRYPRDSLEAMRTRVERGDFDGVPYLRDESQSVARAYGAKTTPDVYVLDRDGVLRYRGAPDGDCDDPAQNAVFLRGAIDAVLAGAEPNPAKTKSVGCSIKWKSRWGLRHRVHWRRVGSWRARRR